jgi:hypothetical protein
MLRVPFSRFERWQSAALYLGMSVFRFIPFALDAYLAHQGQLFPLFPMEWRREPFPVDVDGVEIVVRGKTWGPLAIGRKAPGEPFLLVHRASASVIFRGRYGRCVKIARALAPVPVRWEDVNRESLLAHARVRLALAPFPEMRA